MAGFLFKKSKPVEGEIITTVAGKHGNVNPGGSNEILDMTTPRIIEEEQLKFNEKKVSEGKDIRNQVL